MPELTEGELVFGFPDGWQAEKFDDWSFYKNQFMKLSSAEIYCPKCGDKLWCAKCSTTRVAGTRGIDILAIEPKVCMWIIEVKDYSRHPRTKTVDLSDEVALKVRDSLAALVAAQANANVTVEKSMAGGALRCPRVRIVLHLEQTSGNRIIFRRLIDPAMVVQRLKQLAKAIDPHPLVIEIGQMDRVVWTAKRKVP